MCLGDGGGDREVPATTTPAALRAPRELGYRGGQTGPVVDHLDPRTDARRPPPDLHDPAAVLDGIGDQVAGRLGQPKPVAPHASRAARPPQAQFRPALPGAGSPAFD